MAIVIRLPETTTPVPETTTPAGSPPPVERHRLTTIAFVVQGSAFGVLVGLYGSPLWQVMRVTLVVGVTVGAVVGERRLRQTGRGMLAVGIGVLGTTTGVGIGLMHVAKSDLDAIAVAGVVALVTGLYLSVSGTVTLLRATKGWWRLLAIPVAFLVLEFVFIPFTEAIYASNVPATPLDNATPASKGLAYRDVSFTTSNGVRLSAWYIPSQNGAAVIVLHGSGSARTSVLDQATVLARRGFGVLMVDARGHGRSAGDAMDFGWWGNRDISAAVTWLGARNDVHGAKIAVLGESMGGEEGIGAAATDRRLRAVVAEGAMWRGAMDTSWLPRDFQGYVERAMRSVETWVSNVLTSAPEPASLRSAVAAIAPRPVLLIAGKPEIQADRTYRDASPSTVQLWELPDTPHTGGLSTHPQEWTSRVVGFLDGALGIPGSRT